MRPFLLTAVFVAAMLAGCADAPAAEGETDGDSMEAEAGLALPEWQVGDWWEYWTTDTTQDDDRSIGYVVGSESSTAWIMETTDEDMAFYHSEFGPISYLGEQNKENLAGSQSTGAVKFFDWPLHDGKTWTADWDGARVDIVAEADGADAYKMTATRSGTLFAEYRYSAATGWFDYLQFHNFGTWRMELTDSGRAYSGEMVRAEAQLIDSQTGQAGARSSTYEPFNAAADADLYLYYSGRCATPNDSGVNAPFEFALGPAENVPGAANEGFAANDDGFTVVTSCPYQEDFNGTIGLSPNEGTWGYLISGPPEAEWSFILYLREFERITL